MTHASIARRIAALEAARTPPPLALPSMGGVNLLVLLIAGHLGGMTERDAVAEAYGRALGYAGGPGLRSALRSDAEEAAHQECDHRHREAVARLLALRGVSTDHGGGPVCDALRSLFDDLPEHARRHPFGHQVGVSLNEVMDSFL